MKLATFATWCLSQGPFAGCDLDGGDVQDKALRLGLISPTVFDPDIHKDPNETAEKGDTWYEFSDEFKAAVAAELK